MRCILDKEKFVGLEYFDTVRITVEDDRVLVYCMSNLGIKYEFLSHCEKTQGGIAVFGAKMLAAKVKSLPGDSVVFKNNVISDSSKRVFHKLPVLSDNESVGVIDERNFDWSIDVGCDEFFSVVDNVSFCVMSRRDRPVTNNICVKIRAESVTSFGFDGYKLASSERDIDLGKYIDESIFVHVSTISMLKRWVKGKKRIRIGKKGAWIYISNVDSSICFLQQSVDVPDFNKILDFPAKCRVYFDKIELQRALQSLVLTDEGIYFVFKNGKCKLRCIGDDNSSSAAIIGFECDCDPVDFKVNGKFIVDVLRKVPGKKFSINLGNKSQDPVLVFSKDIKCAIAPMVM